MSTYVMLVVLLIYLLTGLANTASLPPSTEPQIREDWDTVATGHYSEPVIFEPKQSIKLSRSTYKVTSYVDFAPYLESFLRYRAYLHDFERDMKDPIHVSYLITAGDTLTDEQKDWNAHGLNLEQCHKNLTVDNNYYCRLGQQYLNMQSEISFIKKIFDAVYQRFLSAIDHLDYHPSQETETEIDDNRTRQLPRDRTPRSVPYTPRRQYDKVSKAEYIFIGRLVRALKKINSPLHKTLSRQKRFGIMSWILGWGVFSNAKAINQIKDNIDILQRQNELQEDQIMELAHFLNLTMVQVSAHQEAIYELDTNLQILNMTLQRLMTEMNRVQYSITILNDIRTGIGRLTSGLLSLKENVESLYEYMRVLASQQVNPLILPPMALRNVLVTVKKEMAKNPRLALPEDPDKNIWAYYSIMKVTPVVSNDFLLIILTIPLIDTSLEMKVYKVHNLPALHPKLGIQFTYVLEGTYLAIDKHNLYVALPTENDIKICMATQGYLCMINQALYPIKTVEWCVYALFTKNTTGININCKVNPEARHTDLAVNLDGYLWAISSFASDQIVVRCLQDTHVEYIKSPLTIIYIGNGCEGFGSKVYIAAKSDLTSEEDTSLRESFFIGFNFVYQNINRYGLWLALGFAELSVEKMQQIRDKIAAFPPMTLNHLKKSIKDLLIDTEYWSVHPNLLFGILMVSGFISLVVIALLVFCVCRLHKRTKIAQPIAEVLQSTLATKESMTTAYRPNPPFGRYDPVISRPEAIEMGPLLTPDSPPPPPVRSSSLRSSTSTLPDVPILLDRAAKELEQKGIYRAKPYQKYLAKKFSEAI